jgi:hypothetical protein
LGMLRPGAPGAGGGARGRPGAAPWERDGESYTGTHGAHSRTQPMYQRAPSHSTSSFSRSGRHLLLERLHLYHYSHLLYSSAFVRPSVMLMMIAVNSGRCLDASDSFLSVAGWTRSEAIGTICYGPYIILSSLSSSAYPRCNYNLQDRPPAVDERGELGPAPVFEHQLASTKRAIGELIRGEKDSVNVVWRMSFKVGKGFEVRTLCWMGKGLESIGGSGAGAGGRGTEAGHRAAVQDAYADSDEGLYDVLGGMGMSDVEAGAKRLEPTELVMLTTADDITPMADMSRPAWGWEEDVR